MKKGNKHICDCREKGIWTSVEKVSVLFFYMEVDLENHYA